MGLCLLGTGTIVAATPLQKECKKVTKQLKKEGFTVELPAAHQRGNGEVLQ